MPALRRESALPGQRIPRSLDRMHRLHVRFGCVGLARRHFHILNVAYDRATYFEVTARLARELRVAIA